MAVIGNSPATTGTTVSAQSFNGDNSTVAFTLTRSVNSTVDLEVLVDNVQQSPYDGSYSVSGTTLTFSAAPATGTNNIYVIYRGATIATAQVIPDDGSVTNVKMANNAIEATNIASNAVTVDKLNGGSVEGLMTTQFGRRNLIINGAMQVAQRGTSAANNSSDGVFVCDRWRQFHNGTGLVYDIEQSTDAPDGFATSYKATCDTAGSGTDYYQAIIQRIEAQNVQHLKYGTASAETTTLSFWVKSSETGDFTLLAFCQDGNRASNYAVTINSANTWEYKTVIITGDASGTINNDNGRGIDLWFVFSAGSDWTSGTFTGWESYVSSKFAGHNTIDTNTAGKTFQLTGVQLEVGSVATPFEHRSYGEELDACMRYYQYYSSKDYTLTRTSKVEGSTNDANFPTVRTPLSKWMRANPTATFSNGSVTSSGTDFRFIGFYGNTSISAGQTDLRTTTVDLDAEL
jgi:hypothetical protein